MEKAYKIGEPCKSLLEAYYIQKKTMPEIAEFLDTQTQIMRKRRNINAW